VGGKHHPQLAPTGACPQSALHSVRARPHRARLSPRQLVPLITGRAWRDRHRGRACRRRTGREGLRLQRSSSPDRSLRRGWPRCHPGRRCRLRKDVGAPRHPSNSDRHCRSRTSSLRPSRDRSYRGRMAVEARCPRRRNCLPCRRGRRSPNLHRRRGSLEGSLQASTRPRRNSCPPYTVSRGWRDRRRRPSSQLDSRRHHALRPGSTVLPCKLHRGWPGRRRHPSCRVDNRPGPLPRPRTTGPPSIRRRAWPDPRRGRAVRRGRSRPRRALRRSSCRARTAHSSLHPASSLGRSRRRLPRPPSRSPCLRGKRQGRRRLWGRGAARLGRRSLSSHRVAAAGPGRHSRQSVRRPDPGHGGWSFEGA
jgi:hypothetical protein